MGAAQQSRGGGHGGWMKAHRGGQEECGAGENVDHMLQRGVMVGHA